MLMLSSKMGRSRRHKKSTNDGGGKESDVEDHSE
jgi:hypothetical protein